MTIRKFCDLNQNEIATLYNFCKAFQPEQFYETVDEMDTYYRSAHLAKGRQHLSYWEKDQVIASMGYIDRALEHQGEIYLTHGFVGKSSLEAFKTLMRFALHDLSALHHQEVLNLSLVKLGVRGMENALEQWTMETGWASLYAMLKLKKILSREDELAPLLSTRLSCQTVSDQNWQSFLDIHNRSFERVPNGAPLEEDEGPDLIRTYTENQGKLWLFFDQQIPVSIVMLEKKRNDTTMVLEAIGVDPNLHGKGYGRETLNIVCNTLEKKGIQNLELMVMDANKTADRLYRSMGFDLQDTVVVWRSKPFKDLIKEFG